MIQGGCATCLAAAMRHEQRTLQADCSSSYSQEYSKLASFNGAWQASPPTLYYPRSQIYGSKKGQIHHRDRCSGRCHLREEDPDQPTIHIVRDEMTGY